MLVVVLVLAGAMSLMFVASANLFPDWTWKIVNPAWSTVEGRFRKKPKVDLSKYAAPSTGPVELSGLSCPPLPRNVLYTLVTNLPSDESCASKSGDYSKNNYGDVGYPLRGWVGCYVGHDLEGVHVDALSHDGKEHLASATTNARGRFLFPNLKAGSYHLVVNSKGLERIDAIVTTTSDSDSSICLVAAGTAD
jgi:hypothetical protein